MFNRRARIAQKLQGAFRRALMERDIPALQKLSEVFVPADQRPKDEHETAIFMHITRTMADWLEIEHRAYSHYWLLDNGLPSYLPPQLMPKAERFKPQVHAAVGIAAGTGKDWLKPALPLVVDAMVKAVQNNQELITGDPELLRDKIQFARRDEFRRLFGAYDAKEVER